MFFTTNRHINKWKLWKIKDYPSSQSGDLTLAWAATLLHIPLPALHHLYPSTSPSVPQGLAYALRPTIFQVGPAAKAGREKLQGLLGFKDALTWNCTIHPTGSAGMRHLEKLHLWAARIYSNSREQKLAQLGHIQRAANMHSELAGKAFSVLWGMSKKVYLSVGPFSLGLR